MDSHVLEYFGVLASEKAFVSRDYHFNKVKTFHRMMDERTQEEPIAWDLEGRPTVLALRRVSRICLCCKQFEEEFPTSCAVFTPST